MAPLHLIIGPVGAGKSTFARQLCLEHRATLFDLDDWMATLFGDDVRPEVGRIEWYVARTKRCIDQIWKQADALLELGTPVVLEIGLIQRPDRGRFYERVDKRGHALTVYVLDAPREERRERVARRNTTRGDTFSMEVPMPFFEIASDLWEPPDDDERATRDLRFAEATTRSDDGAFRWLY